jgi:hypothetical protein
MSLTKLSLGGNNLIIPVQGEYDISAGCGKTANLFLQCMSLLPTSADAATKALPFPLPTLTSQYLGWNVLVHHIIAEKSEISTPFFSLEGSLVLKMKSDT